MDISAVGGCAKNVGQANKSRLDGRKYVEEENDPQKHEHTRMHTVRPLINNPKG